jgi:site-specific recombinase XerC
MPANDANENAPFALSTERVDWESVMGAFLAEKLARSGSTRTPEAYGRILLRFFGQLAKTPPEVTVAEVFAFAHAVGPSGRSPSGSTINLRLAALSSFYGFLVRLDLAFRNPCDRVMRPHVEPGPARGLTPAELKRLQRAIPATPAGTRDRAIVLMLVLTGVVAPRYSTFNAATSMLAARSLSTRIGARAVSEGAVSCRRPSWWPSGPAYAPTGAASRTLSPPSACSTFRPKVFT